MHAAEIQKSVIKFPYITINMSIVVGVHFLLNSTMFNLYAHLESKHNLKEKFEDTEH